MFRAFDLLHGLIFGGKTRDLMRRDRVKAAEMNRRKKKFALLGFLRVTEKVFTSKGALKRLFEVLRPGFVFRSVQ